MAKRVTIQLDVPRELRFDGKALVRLEEIAGMNVVALIREFQAEDVEGLTEEEAAQKRAAKFSLRRLVQVVQAGVSGELPHSSEAEITELMDQGGKGDNPFTRILSYAEVVFNTLAEAIGADEKNAASGPDKKAKK